MKDSILNDRYRIQQTICKEQVGAIAISIYLAENLEIPTTPKPLCVIYCWQFINQENNEFDHEAIASKLYEVGQNYTLAPKVQAFFSEDNYYYLVCEYLEGYDYLKEFSTEFSQPESTQKSTKDSDISTIWALPIAHSLIKYLAQIPILTAVKFNRRQLLSHGSMVIAGFVFGIFLEKLKPQPQPIVIVESPQIPEPPPNPIKTGEKAFRDNLGNHVYMEMVRIPSGKFAIGSPINEFGRRNNESPVSEVNVPSFYIAKFVTTQEQWMAILGSNPATFRENLQAPVENISWIEAQEFCRKLAMRSSYNYIYRLPSEAEWEYACRAGTNTAYHFGDSFGELSDYAWFADNSRKRSQPIGQKVPNPWGLYDMHGGIWEWCEDNWHDNFNGAPADGKAWIDDSLGRRVRKGGSWNNDAKLCRSATREWHWQGDRYNDIGFRVVISAS